MIRVHQKIELILFALAFVSTFDAKSQTVAKNEFEILNPNWFQEGKIVYISYELIGPSDKTYEVKLVLRNDREQKSVYIPRTVGGDIGEIVGGTKERVISWDLEKDFPKGLEGEGYFFEISVSIKSGRFPWLLVTGGTVVAAVAVYYIFSHKEELKDPLLPSAPVTRP